MTLLSLHEKASKFPFVEAQLMQKILRWNFFDIYTEKQLNLGKKIEYKSFKQTALIWNFVSKMFDFFRS